MEALKNKLTRSNIKCMILCFIFGIALLLVEFKDWLPVGNKVDLNYLENVSELTTGRASMVVFYTPDYYMCYTEEDYDEKEIARDYLVPVGGEDADTWAYMGVELWGKKNDLAYENMEKIYDAEEEDDAFYDSLNYISVSGHVQEMDSDQKHYLSEFIDYLVYDLGYDRKEAETMFVPYVLMQNRVTFWDDHMALAIAFIFVGAGLLAGAFYYLFGLLFGNPLKPFIVYGRSHNGEDEAMIKGEYLLNNVTPQYNMRADDDMFIYQAGRELWVFDPRDMLWAYERMVKRKSGLITVGKYYYVVIRTKDGAAHQISVKPEQVQEYLRTLGTIVPDIILGYSDRLNREFNKNRQEMVNEILFRRAQRLGTASASTFEDTSYAGTVSTTEPVSAAGTVSTAEPASATGTASGFGNENAADSSFGYGYDMSSNDLSTVTENTTTVTENTTTAETAAEETKPKDDNPFSDFWKDYEK